MSDSTIELLLSKKIPIVTTFAPVVMQSQPEVARKFNIPEWKLLERQKAVADPSRYQGIVNAAKAGVVIGFGTDAGSPAVGHGVVVPELKFMVQLGVVADNYAAIRSATSVAAQISRLSNRLGTLTPGKLADLVVVEGNPLENLDALSQVRRTYVAGKRLV
jgi:imidazolonepropionase-like amidohydrolase